MGEAVDDEELPALLLGFVAARVGRPGDLELAGLRRTSAGFSRENWVFDARWSDPGGQHDEKLILRRDPLGSVLRTDRRVEVAVLRALEAGDVPAPRVRWADVDGAELGRPSVVMWREDGECEYFCLTSAHRPLAARLGLAREFVGTLARICLTDWRANGLGEVLDDPGAAAAAAALAHWEGELRRVQREPLPEVEVALCWLAANAPRAQATVLVHGDFKPGNALVRGDHVGVVLDWETAHLGDPLEDLGWVTNPVRRREHQIPGAWERDDIVAHWSSLTGFSATPEDLTWWNVFANFKLAVIVLTGAAEFIDGRVDRPHAAPLSLCRVMYDLIGL